MKKNKVPSFSFMGGKCKIRKWLIEKFPKSGNRYIEPFCGRGNVYFLAVRELDFKEFIINDLDTSFFSALLSLDCETIPLEVNKQQFDFYRKNPSSLSKVLEAKLSFCGKGFSGGFRTSDCKDGFLNIRNYKENCKIAQDNLKLAKITQLDYKEAIKDLDEDDFVYLDPPYLKFYEKTSPYENINHKELIYILNNAKFKWAISGYPSDLYEKELRFKNKYETIRNWSIKVNNNIVETLWSNF